MPESHLDLSPWSEKPRGVGHRRWAIVSTGLRQIMSLRICRALLIMAWSAGLLVAVIGFLFSQTVATGGWLETYAAHLGPRFAATAAALGGLVDLYPDICIRGLFTLLFWLHSFIGLGLSLIALTIVVPRLVTRDRASHALTIYLARPLNSRDYLLGKLGIIAGLLVLMWTGPLLFGWALSLLLAPDSNFFVYSLAPMLRALLFNGIGLLALGSIALGVSACTRSSRNTILLWIGLWLIAGTLAKPPNTPQWIQRASFSHDLGQVRAEVFRLDDSFAAAAAELPLLNSQFSHTLDQAAKNTAPTDFWGALISLGVIMGLAASVFFRKLRPE